MTDTTFKVDPEIILGAGTISRIGAAAASLGKKALIITGQGQFSSRMIDRVSSLLEDAGVDAIKSDTIPILAAADVAEAAGELARGSRAALIVAVGGPLIQALARTAAACSSGQSIYDFLDGVPPEAPFLPYIAVPSANDPFLLSPRYVLTDPRDRLVKLVSAPAGICRAVFWDSGIAEDLPEKNPEAAAFDGFLAALEAYCSLKGNALSEALLEKALSRFAGLWPAVFNGEIFDAADFAPDSDALSTGEEVAALEEGAEEDGASPEGSAFDGFDEGAAENSGDAAASCLLSLGCAASAPGIGTALSWALSGRFPVERSLISAALLPHIVERLAQARPEKAARAAYLAGAAESGAPATEAAGQFAEKIRGALEAAGISPRLRDTGLNLDRMAPAIEAARDLEFVAHSPWTVTVEEAFEIVKAAL
jgi:alcohol dehydrogenase